MAELTLDITRTINATPEAVFNAWLNPKTLARFMLPGPGMTVSASSNNPVVGGRFDIVMQGTGDPLPHGGVYREITPHSRLVFSWESPFYIEGSTVTLTFTPVPGGTKLDLHHVRFPDVASRDDHINGWNVILQKLDEILSA